MRSCVVCHPTRAVLLPLRPLRDPPVQILKVVQEFVGKHGVNSMNVYPPFIGAGIRVIPYSEKRLATTLKLRCASQLVRLLARNRSVHNFPRKLPSDGGTRTSSGHTLAAPCSP